MTLIQLHVTVLEKKRVPEGSPQPMMIPQSVIQEILRICKMSPSNEESWKSNVNENHANSAISSAQWVFNRQHNGLGNQVRLLRLKCNITLTKLWSQ